MNDTPTTPASEPAVGPEVEADLAAEQLPCGRPTDDLLELVMSGPGADPADLDDLDDHQRSCVHCRAVLVEAGRLWGPVRELAARHESPPPSLLERIMEAVRSLGREPLHLVLPGGRGVTRIAATALVRIAEQAAAGVPGVRVVLARGSDVRVDVDPRPGQPGPHGAVGVAGQQTVVDLAVVVTYGESVPAVAAQVRSGVQRSLVALASAGAVVVDIYVDDVLPALDG